MHKYFPIVHELKQHIWEKTLAAGPLQLQVSCHEQGQSKRQLLLKFLTGR